MKKGYIYLHRKILENPIVMKDSDHLSVWIYLLLEATHKKMDVLFKGNRITLLPGQLITGRKTISSLLCVDEAKIQRILKYFENNGQIEQQASNKNRLISIIKWGEYQKDEQQVNNNCTTDEQQVNTNNNDNNVNNENKKEEIYKEEKYGFLHNVNLSKKEYQKLKEQFTDYEEKINNLSGYIGSHGDKYKSHYLTILNWARKENNNLPEWFDNEPKRKEIDYERKKLAEQLTNGTWKP